MAFPGERVRQKRFEIAAANVIGAVNHDFPLILTEAHFNEDDLTLGGTNALQAASLVASKDEFGQYQYAMGQIRVELNATWTLSKVELVVCVPAEEISTLDNAQVWLWWGSAVDVAPASTEDFGMHDVFNGVTDSTGGRVPLITRCAVMMDALPTATAPQYTDISGSGQHVTQTTTSGISRVDMIPGRGMQGAGGSLLAAGAFVPGLGAWSIIECCPPVAGQNAFFASDNWNISSDTGVSRFYIASGYNANVSTGETGVRVLSMTRDGNTVTCVSDELYATRTGLSAVSFSTVTATQVRRGGGSASISLAYFLYCAPNLNWHTLHSRVIHNTTGTIISYASKVVGVTGTWTTVVFDGLHAGTEVRVYETPHNAIWAIDLDGAVSANIGADYVTFSVVTATTTDKHLIYWTTNPNKAGYAAHQVTRAGGETDAQLAALAAAVIDAIDDVSATATGAVVTVTGARNGTVENPYYGGLQGVVDVTQIGGTLTSEIDGIESSTGTSWTADVLVDRPRLVILTMLSLAYKNIRYTTQVTTAELRVPAGALQVEDLNYANPA